MAAEPQSNLRGLRSVDDLSVFFVHHRRVWVTVFGLDHVCLYVDYDEIDPLDSDIVEFLNGAEIRYNDEDHCFVFIGHLGGWTCSDPRIQETLLEICRRCVDFRQVVTALLRYIGQLPEDSIRCVDPTGNYRLAPDLEASHGR